MLPIGIRISSSPRMMSPRPSAHHRRTIPQIRAAGISNLLAGIALVEVERIHIPMLEQIQADLIACQDADADGLVLSWNLWRIPLKYILAISEL